MTDKNAEKKVKDPKAEAKNWEDRLRSEQAAPHKWNEDWGSLFNNGIPNGYTERVKYLEELLKSKPDVKVLPKYGLGSRFKEPPQTDFRRKKMFEEDPLDFEE